MSILKQEAIKIIEEMQEDAMLQVVAYLKSIASNHPGQDKHLQGFQTLQSFVGSLPEDFDYNQELEAIRKEKYDRFN